MSDKQKRRAPGEGTAVTKRADGRWEARVTLPDGTRRTLYGRTREEARRKRDATLRDVAAGLPLPGAKQTVAAYVADWLATVKPTVRPGTYRRYEELTRRRLVPHVGRTALAQLSAQQLQRAEAAALEAGLAPATVRQLHAVTHRLLGDALRLGLVQRNVADLVRAPRVPRREPHVLTLEQVKALLAAAQGDRLEALYQLALGTGMRAGELLALRWRAVDLADGREGKDGKHGQQRRDGQEGQEGQEGAKEASLSVVATLQRAYGPKGGFALAEPKTAQSRRRITLAPFLVEVLRRHRARQREERLAAGDAWDEHDLVFCDVLGRPFDQQHLLRVAFYPLLERAGLPRLRFHDLRHTAATLLLAEGLHPEIVRDLLGHSTITLTVGTYSHITPTMQRLAAAAMQRLLGSEDEVEDADAAREEGARSRRRSRRR